MTEQELFIFVGTRPLEENRLKKKRRFLKIPWISLAVLGIIVTGCLFAELIMMKDPSYLDLANNTHVPDGEFLFGTDALGRDIFSCIWYGGRVSLLIGFFSTLISTGIAVIYGSFCGLAPAWLDAFFMRLTEIFLSIPNLLAIIFLQAVLGDASVLSLSVVIGVTSWCSIAKVVRTEVRQLKSSEYVIASKCMGGGFFHILCLHLVPNLVSSIMFMVVMNVRSAIVAESTLSFLGMGLPLGVISWGSMLSLAEQALMTRAWWMILIPGGFLVILLVCLTNIGNWLRRSVSKRERNL